MSEDGLPARRRRRRLGQSFLADPNLLDAIVREARIQADEVILEIGGGEGALTGRLAESAATVHVIELDERLRGALERVAEEHPTVHLHWGDAVRLDLKTLHPAPTAVVSNLPYAVATPVILRTIAEAPTVRTWTVMVQREIADRLRARPGGADYGAVSVIAQLACRIEMLRTVNRAVFVPRPRVDSAVIRLERLGSPPDPWIREVVRGAFAHRRKGLATSLELARGDLPEIKARTRDALVALGLESGSRAQELEPAQFVALAQRLGGVDG